MKGVDAFYFNICGVSEKKSLILIFVENRSAPCWSGSGLLSSLISWFSFWKSSQMKLLI